MRGDTLVSCARPRSRARPFRSLAWGDAISRPLVLPTGAVEARRHEPKNHRERFGLCFVYQQYDNHGVSGGLSIVNYDSANIRRIERGMV